MALHAIVIEAHGGLKSPQFLDKTWPISDVIEAEGPMLFVEKQCAIGYEIFTGVHFTNQPPGIISLGRMPFLQSFCGWIFGQIVDNQISLADQIRSPPNLITILEALRLRGGGAAVLGARQIAPGWSMHGGRLGIFKTDSVSEDYCGTP